MVKKAITAAQVLLILIFLGCALYVAKYFYDAHKSREDFNELRTEVKAAETVDASGNYGEKYAENGMLLSYYELYEKNSDMKGWLSIKDTPIDYPVMQAEDNEYYLHRDFDKQRRYSGIPFLDYQCSQESRNQIIYAHNMKDGSMFAAVSNYDDAEFYAAHKKIKYDTLFERGEYEIMSVFRTTVGSKNEFKYHEYADIRDEDEFNEYTGRVKAMSMYDTGTDAEWGDMLLTLSTCAYHTSNERIVVVAVKKGE